MIHDTGFTKRLFKIGRHIKIIPYGYFSETKIEKIQYLCLSFLSIQYLSFIFEVGINYATKFNFFE